MTPPINSVSDERLAFLAKWSVYHCIPHGVITPKDSFLEDPEEIHAILTELAARRAANIPVEAAKVVDKLFADLRDRRFLKWLFKDEEGVIGDFPALRSIDLEAQQEIRDAWAAIIAPYISPAQPERDGE